MHYWDTLFWECLSSCLAQLSAEALTGIRFVQPWQVTYGMFPSVRGGKSWRVLLFAMD